MSPIPALVMPSATRLPLPQQTYSLDHQAWADYLATTENLLIVQDLDGVCMELVQDPLDRVIDPAYVAATHAFAGHFFVLTNGEHTGPRGVNRLIERALGAVAQGITGAYLPGLAAGGVQWQTSTGQVSHPGVSAAELSFLAAVPGKMRQRLQQFFQAYPGLLSAAEQQQGMAASVLDNVASPTVNLNTWHQLLSGYGETYRALQQAMQALMTDLLAQADHQGLGDSFFVHYAPNHGRAADGVEIPWLSEGPESGTTDFQFMLRGAVKEAGVLVLLNRYYAQRTGVFPLGEAFHGRQAPQRLVDLLELAIAHFDPVLMPIIVGVGDTVTSVVHPQGEAVTVRRGGSDRNFLQLIQALGTAFQRGNLVTYVDSSGGELKNRTPLTLGHRDGQPLVTAGPGDPRDREDPLTLNVVFPGGHRQYCRAFCTAAQQRRKHQRI